MMIMFDYVNLLNIYLFTIYISIYYLYIYIYIYIYFTLRDIQQNLSIVLVYSIHTESHVYHQKGCIVFLIQSCLANHTETISKLLAVACSFLVTFQNAHQ